LTDLSPYVLAPGETGYYIDWKNLDDVLPADIPGYDLTMIGEVSDRALSRRLPVTGVIKAVSDSDEAAHQVLLTLPNHTNQTAYEMDVVYAVYDEAGKLLYADWSALYPLRLPVDAYVDILLDVDSSFSSYWVENGIVPASVQAFAYYFEEE